MIDIIINIRDYLIYKNKFTQQISQNIYNEKFQQQKIDEKQNMNNNQKNSIGTFKLNELNNLNFDRKEFNHIKSR